MNSPISSTLNQDKEDIKVNYGHLDFMQKEENNLF
jgi:hypothetical protein